MDRRSNRRKRRMADRPSPGRDEFTDCGLLKEDFDVQSGGGKSFLSGQRIVWMTVTHKSSGKVATGRIGTTKKGFEVQRRKLLQQLLQSFQGT